ncbi:MAG: N-acetylmuramoyl-L-alanine amidase [Pseudomonadota bacterium]|nr:N-acetylmuramoyl-L-alanine amidase [Pseudomonadota bacterium]
MNRVIFTFIFFVISICNAKPKNFTDKINIPVSFPFSYSVVEQDEGFLVTIATKKVSGVTKESQCINKVTIKNKSELQFVIKKSCFVNFIPVVGDKDRFSLDIVFYSDSKEFLADKEDFLSKAYENRLRINLSNRDYIDAQERFHAETKLNPVRKGDFVLVLDPGHGGFDPGAVSQWGLEKDFNLLFAKKVQARLNAKPGYKVYLTRDKDEYITMGGRVRYTSYHGADLFLSFHLDASSNKSVRGHRVFVLSESGSQTENLYIKNKLDAIKFDLQQAQTLFYSALVADYVNINIATMLDQKLSRVYQTGFGVLKSPTTPSVLIEFGFITNKHDMSLINDPNVQDDIVTAVISAIESFASLFQD